MYLYRLAGTAPEAAVCHRGRPIARWTPRLQDTGAQLQIACVGGGRGTLSSKTERMKLVWGEGELWEGLHLKPANQKGCRVENLRNLTEGTGPDPRLFSRYASRMLKNVRAFRLKRVSKPVAAPGLAPTAPAPQIGRTTAPSGLRRRRCQQHGAVRQVPGGSSKDRPQNSHGHQNSVTRNLYSSAV